MRPSNGAAADVYLRLSMARAYSSALATPALNTFSIRASFAAAHTRSAGARRTARTAVGATRERRRSANVRSWA